MSATPFAVHFDHALREDLLHRLAATHWSDAVTSDWRYGMNESFLRALVQHWRTRYDFAAAQARLNQLPQFRVQVGDVGVHYVHLRGCHPGSTPLLLMNGWPSSFVEYGRLLPQLVDPAAFGASAAESFDVVIPTLPGFGFSNRPTSPYAINTEDLFHALMTRELGYPGYLAAGTDIGAGVATRLALKYPDSIKGIHISAVVDPHLPPGAPPLTAAEQAYRRRVAKWEADEGAYEHLQCTRPQTLAFALADSPVGLASWIVEKFHYWSDHHGDLLEVFPLDFLIDNVMVYWASASIGSSLRYYYDNRHYRRELQVDNHVEVPTAVCMWPKDLVTAPREWAARFYNVRQFSEQPRGGHFPAWEAPGAYAQDLRLFARGLSGAWRSLPETSSAFREPGGVVRIPTGKAAAHTASEPSLTPSKRKVDR